MDYIIDLSSLSSKSNDLNSSKKKIDNINEIDTFSDQDISSYLKNINETIKRIKNGYNNASTWLTSYIDDMKTLESNLSSLNSANLITPTEFNKEFEDIFSKVTMPAIKTGGSNENLKSLGSLANEYYGTGTFEHKTYTDSNGITLSYYIYVPEYSGSEKLPILVYDHGSGENGSGVLNTGLPSMLNNGSINPEGIVICIQDDSGNFSLSNSTSQAALIDAVNDVVEKYNGDSDAISFAGHSQGASRGYSIVNNYPNYFSAFAPISGWSGNLSSWNSNAKVCIIHGDKDANVGYDNATYAENLIKNSGGDVTLTTLGGKDHIIQGYSFTNELITDNGETYNLMDWLMSQSKNS